MSGSGGGIRVTSGGAGFTLRDCKVFSCWEDGGDSSRGGGMYAQARVNILDCWFATNRTDSGSNIRCDGGGLSLEGSGYSLISNTVFLANNAHGNGGWPNSPRSNSTSARWPGD